MEMSVKLQPLLQLQCLVVSHVYKYCMREERVHPKFNLPDCPDVSHSPNYWSNSEVNARFVDKEIILYVKRIMEVKSIPEQGEHVGVHRFTKYSIQYASETKAVFPVSLTRH